MNVFASFVDEEVDDDEEEESDVDDASVKELEKYGLDIVNICK